MNLSIKRCPPLSRRPKAGPSEGHRRAEVYPVILRQSSAAPEDAGDEEGEDGDQPDVIRIGERSFVAAASKQNC
jgi:hypothetical protein